MYFTVHNKLLCPCLFTYAAAASGIVSLTILHIKSRSINLVPLEDTNGCSPETARLILSPSTTCVSSYTLMDDHLFDNLSILLYSNKILGFWHSAVLSPQLSSLVDTV